ncbi:MAG: hypothetical protein WDO14_02620 [Bacteroidota bacterium]
MIKRSLLLFMMLFACAQMFAQKKVPKTDGTITVAMKPESWTAKNDAANLKFADHKGVPSLEVTDGNEQAKPSNINFSSGTIEFDLEFIEGFTSFFFRYQSEEEYELFYLRNRPDDITATDGVQYAPIIKKVNMWDMYPNYQTAANFKKGEWTHIKLVISGVQMLVYVNDKNPTLVVPRLEGNTKDGTIGFSGKCFVSNLVIKPNQVEGLSAMGEFDPVYNDNRFISSWFISEPVDFPAGNECSNSNPPGFETKWKKITAERNGLINVSRLYGQSTSRRMVWLRTTLKTKKEEKRKINLGFSDEVWVFVNGRTAYADKNLYAQDLRKEPDGRLSVENAQFELSLKEGNNDILIGLSNDFYGWGIIARLENRIGVEYIDYVPEVLNKEFEPYFGMYASKDTPFKLKVSQLSNKLSIQATGEGPIATESAGNGVYKIDNFGITLEFNAAEKKMYFRRGTTTYEFIKE